MEKSIFIKDFVSLGVVIKQLLQESDSELHTAMNLAYSENSFFTPYMQKKSLETICNTFLIKEELERWLESYSLPDKNNKTIGIIMAGNIPLVGFHDFLCVMACEAKALIKLSSKDKILLPFLVKELLKINRKWSEKILFVNDAPNESDIDAIISTGSNLTAKAVNDKYLSIPKLIRGRRFSFAVLAGNEDENQMQQLATDTFLYYGLGCRSINYLWVPQGYDFKSLIENFSVMQTLCADPCYMNNFKRRRALLTMEGETFIDGGFFLLVKDNVGDMFPPIGEIRYREYCSLKEIESFVEKNRDQIQKKYCTFGVAQMPLIDEYADNVDTMAFILKK